MAVTVELPPDVARKVRVLASRRGLDEAEFLAALAAEEVASLSDFAPGESRVMLHPKTGLPVLSGGLRLTRREIDDLLDEE